MTAVLHATTQAQPAGFEKSMDKLFSLVGLPPVFAGQTLTQRSFVKNSVGWIASQAGPELLAETEQELVVIPDAGHNDLLWRGQALYFGAIAEFVAGVTGH